MKSVHGVFSQAHRSVVFYSLRLVFPVMDALLLGLSPRLPVLKTVHVCLVDSYLKMSVIPRSFLLPPRFLWTQLLSVQVT
jgi:hypothetical protein